MMEAEVALPQLDEAIAYLQVEVAALRAGEKDANLPALAVAVAAGEAPLPEPRFAPLLAVWTPAASAISTELAALVDQFEAARRREEEAARKKEDEDVKIPVHSALQRVRGQRRRPRTRPRRRFEDPDEGDASQSASDGTPTPSPRADVAAVTVTVNEKKKAEEKQVEKEHEKVEKEKADVVMEETLAEAKRVEMTEEKEETTEEKVEEKATEHKVDSDEKGQEEKPVEEKNPEKEEAEAALASLKALRKSMLLDVLSKIVSVAKSKAVNPAMFSTRGKVDEDQVDLEKIQDRVARGAVCDWAQFAEQVYLFCQHVVTDAEQREQPEARRKGVELLHFARTLTETLRKASVKKEAILLQKIRDAEDEAAARKEEAARKDEQQAVVLIEEDEKKRDVKDDEKDKDTETLQAEQKDGQAETADSLDSSSKALYEEASGPPPLTPARASTRIRTRTSISSDGLALCRPIAAVSQPA
ncbi:uncharacterized protein PITG_22404 [Phytophthora infestans T30-4]|uniref:Uncharacterized protein n=1 Tax=Phytophthora infestans (strain T30-4) TaxID=403677 RepID=D0RM94_PHYIT|nr:uncharacterized protein PITG_22404 [Phytophthora infestans T30-4]EEY60488.1 conserved hypothetical protein [Phytophthora infestans T30-4]|eukprot:XP_002909835.1 conserved hypothetical protein [Phytophthora infestans T30-4]